MPVSAFICICNCLYVQLKTLSLCHLIHLNVNQPSLETLQFPVQMFVKGNEYIT